MVHDILRADEGRYWSYLCREPSCCPAEGVPFDGSSHPAGLAMAAAGGPVLAGRDELAATIAPVTGTLAEVMERQTRRAERIAAELLARTAKAPLPVRPTIEHGLRAVQAAITTYRDGGTIEHCYQFAWLALVLTSLRVRDDAWATHTSDCGPT
jgi:hypothetical protein